ncbi:hypothetical protein HXA34_20685 [Salipaludibacillus agaradhaerens]|uniref:hypothetical protein n=1 Tax=Salipaludibacillus agaradhaerens TaxID=76935 RepID=UPI00215098B6|nr:hypothetical protein [Salipaludibacillus agaradhaerens]MCR6108717.1 hypothetical protein [Salipaludibacillus agaradhaerens]MCR6120740.1 hypothetical protein [Salipaludibacillus agaradhaerens]
MNQVQSANLTGLIEQTQNRLERAKTRVDTNKRRLENMKNQGATITMHGGWEKGYWESKVFVLEDILDDLTRLKMLGEPQRIECEG